ncbi:MAG: penicillin-binding protein beta-lactamase class [Chloroflexi bacterium]|jgi:CubicO group peptidase (beta-lactamase class C family)|nr:penicillin-binding protein beta-lactamase class [Chloroflexota bacterium]
MNRQLSLPAPATIVTRRRFLHRAGAATAGVLAAGGFIATGTVAGALLAADALTAEAAAMRDDAAIAREADALLTDAVRQQLFRGSVLIARAGKIVLHKGYDWADVAHHIPNTRHTRFRIASITKQFTAMAILQLQEQGKLHVHDLVSEHLPNTPAAWRQITLQQLLTHTSGIPDYMNFPNFAAVMTRTLSPEQLIGLFRDKPLDFRPGSRWKYSNSGYNVLGYIVALRSGLSFPRFLQRHIFTPLGMADSGYDVNHPALPAHATGYASWTRPAAYMDISVAYADGSLYSTVGDLYRWDQEVTSAHPRLVSRQTMREMFTPYVPTDASHPGSMAYGYGWYIGAQGGRRYIDHTGDINGFLADNGFFPDDKVTLIVLSNLESDAGLRQITGHLAGIIFGLADCVEMRSPCVEM